MDDQPHVFQSRLQGFAERDKAPGVPATLGASCLRCPWITQDRLRRAISDPSGQAPGGGVLRLSSARG
jgi:hypothetical protein